MSPEIVLASSSPRRRELLAQIGLRFRVMPVNVDESPRDGETPRALVSRLALEKARAAWDQLGDDTLVLGADTVVVVGDEVLGKPRDLADASRMLASLSGRTHLVLSAVALVGADASRVRVSESAVTFVTLTAAQIRAYCDSGEPADKAGAYAIQGLGAAFVQRLVGSYSGVMGLPLHETAQLLSEVGIQIPAPSADQ